MIAVGSLVPVPEIRRSLREVLLDGRLQVAARTDAQGRQHAFFVGDGYRILLSVQDERQAWYLDGLLCWFDDLYAVSQQQAAGSDWHCYTRLVNWELAKQRDKFLPGWCGRLERRLTGWEGNMVWRHWRRFLARKCRVLPALAGT